MIIFAPEKETNQTGGANQDKPQAPEAMTTNTNPTPDQKLKDYYQKSMENALTWHALLIKNAAFLESEGKPEEAEQQRQAAERSRRTAERYEHKLAALTDQEWQVTMTVQERADEQVEALADMENKRTAAIQAEEKRRRTWRAFYKNDDPEKDFALDKEYQEARREHEQLQNAWYEANQRYIAIADRNKKGTQQ